MKRFLLFAFVLLSLNSHAEEAVHDQFIPIGPAPDPTLTVPGFQLKRWFRGAFDRLTELALHSEPPLYRTDRLRFSTPVRGVSVIRIRGMASCGQGSKKWNLIGAKINHYSKSAQYENFSFLNPVAGYDERGEYVDISSRTLVDLSYVMIFLTTNDPYGQCDPSVELGNPY